jgi:hypothetical protein
MEQRRGLQGESLRPVHFHMGPGLQHADQASSSAKAFFPIMPYCGSLADFPHQPTYSSQLQNLSSSHPYFPQPALFAHVVGGQHPCFGHALNGKVTSQSGSNFPSGKISAIPVLLHAREARVEVKEDTNHNQEQPANQRVQQQPQQQQPQQQQPQQQSQQQQLQQQQLQQQQQQQQQQQHHHRMQHFPNVSDSEGNSFNFVGGSNMHHMQQSNSGGLDVEVHSPESAPPYGRDTCGGFELSDGKDSRAVQSAVVQDMSAHAPSQISECNDRKLEGYRAGNKGLLQESSADQVTFKTEPFMLVDHAKNDSDISSGVHLIRPFQLSQVNVGEEHTRMPSTQEEKTIQAQVEAPNIAFGRVWPAQQESNAVSNGRAGVKPNQDPTQYPTQQRATHPYIGQVKHTILPSKADHMVMQRPRPDHVGGIMYPFAFRIENKALPQARSVAPVLELSSASSAAVATRVCTANKESGTANDGLTPYCDRMDRQSSHSEAVLKISERASSQGLGPEGFQQFNRVGDPKEKRFLSYDSGGTVPYEGAKCADLKWRVRWPRLLSADADLKVICHISPELKIYTCILLL